MLSPCSQGSAGCGVAEHYYYYYYYLKLSKLKKAGRLKVRVDITLRLMQQDGVQSPQSDRESLKDKLCLLISGRNRSDSVVHYYYYYYYY